MFKSRTKFLTIMACLSFLLACGTFVFCLDRQQLDGSVNIQYVAPPQIWGTLNDVWDSSLQSFNKENLDKLLKMVSGDKASSTTNMSKLESLATSNVTALEMRNFAVGKNAGEDISVVLGEKTWTVCYLSKSKTGDVILTLFLDGNANAVRTRRFCFSSFPDITASAASVTYPANMYGTSYMRSAYLSNGGAYAKSGSEMVTSTIPEREFYFFTKEDYGFLPYVVTPRQVSWQENGQYAKTQLGLSYNLSNENWTQDKNSMPTGFSVNYAGKEGNDRWADDYVWLPSLTEIGYNDSHMGIWELSVEQRSGVENYYSWTRSASPYNGSVYAINYFGNNCMYYAANTANLLYRPAFHLNLTAAANAAN